MARSTNALVGPAAPASAAEWPAATNGAPLHGVAVLAVPGAVLLDLAAPIHLFGHCGAGRYTLDVAGETPGPVPTSTGLDLFVEHGLEALETADTIVVPGHTAHTARPSGRLLDALRAAHERGARIMSICTGAFTLAHAGLLDGRRATTHWFACAEMSERFPQVTVDPAVLYVDEGQILTSAGVAAGLDLCLHVIRRDHGAGVAAAFARRTVVAPHRDGGQAQFVVRPIDAAPIPRLGAGTAFTAAARHGVPPETTPSTFEATRAWALSNLDRPLDVATLAAHAAVSPRTFARRFRDETGTTPGRWVLDQRTAAAQALLERTDLSIEAVAQRSGFGSAASLRDHLARRTKTTPTGYRRTFRGPSPAASRP